MLSLIRLPFPHRVYLPALPGSPLPLGAVCPFATRLPRSLSQLPRASSTGGAPSAPAAAGSCVEVPPAWFSSAGLPWLRLGLIFSFVVLLCAGGQEPSAFKSPGGSLLPSTPEPPSLAQERRDCWLSCH